MKIAFDNVNFGASTGPNAFAYRLANQLAMMGHTIADPDDYDVVLVFIEPTRTWDLRKVVQRLDGIWFAPNEFESKNVGIKRCYDASAGVIWQSQFDRQMIVKWWGEHTGASAVIGNGIDVSRKVTVFTHGALKKLREQYDRVYVCSSNWHPQKRLAANIDLFKHLRSRFFPKSCLIVLGSNPDVIVPDPHVFYTNSVQEDVYLEVYSMADWMLHLAWLDHCPNVVVEALGQGTPIMCSEAGGTKELVKDFGIVLHEDRPYNFELTSYDSPPAIDVTQVDRLFEKCDLGSPADIDIVNVARRYEELLFTAIGKNCTVEDTR